MIILRRLNKKIIRDFFVLFRTLLLLVIVSLCPLQTLIASENEILSGWFPLEPYMHVEDRQGIPHLTGLDIRMLEVATKNAGFRANFEQLPWQQLLAAIKSGKRQIAPFATQTPEREQWAYFSDPYRWEENVLYVKKGTELRFTSIPDLLKEFERKQFRLGVMDGFVYADAQINAYIADPKNAARIIRVKFDNDNLMNLGQGKIDGFFTDRLSGATLVWRLGDRQLVEEIVLGIHTPIHFIMSKQSTTPEMVAKINASLKTMRENGDHSRVMRQYILPVLLMQTIDKPWFFWVEIMAIIAFVISGVIIAERENLNLISAFGLSIVPSFGGGLIRDLIVNRSPVGVLVTPRYIFTVCVVFLIAVLLINIYDILKKTVSCRNIIKIVPADRTIHRIVDIFDAIGTSAFTVIGVLVGVMSHADPLWVWGPLFAVMTGVGGSTIRNTLVGYRALGNDYTYAEIPLLTGLILSIYLQGQTELINPTEILWVVIATIAFGFLFHIAVYFYQIPALKIHLLPSSPQDVEKSEKSET
jgi:polar amino acid transport system substrate-binding protein